MSLFFGIISAGLFASANYNRNAFGEPHEALYTWAWAVLCIALFAVILDIVEFLDKH